MKQPYNTTIYNTALYMRLSRDDENYGDSVSIETQRTILQQYAKEQGLHVVGEYVDDGWSGTNFERPDFQRMMDDVEAGKVNCIVTKDLSRFGREHVMMDYYLEFLFPEKRVRYIAVAENEDTEKGLSDFSESPIKSNFSRSIKDYSMIVATRPDPTVRPPSRYLNTVFLRIFYAFWWQISQKTAVFAFCISISWHRFVTA